MFEGLFQPTHLIILLIIVMLVFGPSKLPQLGGALGKSIRDFKKAVSDPLDGSSAGPPAPGAGAPEQRQLPPADPSRGQGEPVPREGAARSTR